MVIVMPNIHSNISFALVNIPVLMNPIIRNNDTSFNQIIKEKIIKKSSFLDYNIDNVTYIKPKLKCKVKYMERTKENRLRQPFI